MLDSSPSPTIPPDAGERSLKEDIRQFASDARALAEAEAAYQKSRAAFAGQEAKSIAISGLLAAVLVFFALMAVTVGLVFALTPLITAWGATAVVAGTLLAIAAALALGAARRWKRMTSLLIDEPKP